MTRISHQSPAATKNFLQSAAFALIGLRAAFGVGVALENEMALRRQLPATARPRFPAGVLDVLPVRLHPRASPESSDAGSGTEVGQWTLRTFRRCRVAAVLPEGHQEIVDRNPQVDRKHGLKLLLGLLGSRGLDQPESV